MHCFTFFDNICTLKIVYFGLTLNDLHSLIGEMANGEGWKQTSQRLALVNSFRPDVHRQKEVAYLALPFTYHPLLPCPQNEDDFISFLPFWLGNLSQRIRMTSWE